MQKFFHDEKIFLQPKNFCHLCQNSFFYTIVDIQSFWKVHEIGFKKFCMVRKNFCSLTIFAIFVKTHFLIQYLISRVFEIIIRLAWKIFAWWEKISACCKNLHPWFCSLEKPHYSGGVAWWRRPRAQQMDRFWSWPNASIFASFSPNPISAVWLTAYAVVLQGCRCKAKTFCPWMPSAILAHKTTKQAISTGCYYCPQC